jgi:hypothetical protein
MVAGRFLLLIENCGGGLYPHRLNFFLCTFNVFVSFCLLRNALHVVPTF